MNCFFVWSWNCNVYKVFSLSKWIYFEEFRKVVVYMWFSVFELRNCWCKCWLKVKLFCEEEKFCYKKKEKWFVVKINICMYIDCVLLLVYFWVCNVYWSRSFIMCKCFNSWLFKVWILDCVSNWMYVKRIFFLFFKVFLLCYVEKVIWCL